MESGCRTVSGYRRFGCLMARTNIFGKTGNLMRLGLVYTNKTTRGVGG